MITAATPKPRNKPGPPPELPRHPLPGFTQSAKDIAQIDRDLAKLGGMGSELRKERVQGMQAALRTAQLHLDQLISFADAGYASTFAD